MALSASNNELMDVAVEMETRREFLLSGGFRVAAEELTRRELRFREVIELGSAAYGSRDTELLGYRLGLTDV